MEDIERAKVRFGLPEDVRVVSCYKAGRDGFWLHRFLEAQGVDNYVVDFLEHRGVPAGPASEDGSSGPEEPAPAAGPTRVGRRGRVERGERAGPGRRSRRQLHRELEQLIVERTERTNRSKGLLVTQGLQLKLDRDLPKRLEEARLWDDAPLPRQLRARLHREWTRRDAVAEEIRALETERHERLETVEGGRALEQVLGSASGVENESPTAR